MYVCLSKLHEQYFLMHDLIYCTVGAKKVSVPYLRYVRSKATYLLLVKTACFIAASFQVLLYCLSFLFFVSMFISLPFGTSLTFLLGLLSAVLIVVAFHHLATKSSFYFAYFYFYFAVFSRCDYCHLATIVFAAWVAVPFFTSLRNSSHHFYCRAIFIAANHFVAVQPDSNYRSFSFKAGPFFCWIAIFALAIFILLPKTLSL